MASFSSVQQLNDGNVELVDSSGNPLDISGGNLEIAVAPGQSIATNPNTLVPLGFEQLSVTNVAVGLTVPVNAKLALIENDTSVGNPVRWRDDGVAPTAAIGMSLEKGVSFEYTGDLSAIEFVRKGGSNSTLNISYYDFA